MKCFPLRQARCLLIKPAFTLIEVLVVLTLIAFLCMLSIGGLRFSNHQAVSTQARALCMSCRYLQQRALAAQQEQSMTFDPAGAYRLSTGEVYELVRGVQFGSISGALGPPAEPRVAITNPITFVGNKITFYPTGIIQPGTVYLVDRQQQILYAVTVAVSGVSCPRVYRYERGRWQLV